MARIYGRPGPHTSALPRRDIASVDAFYQHTPPQLSAGSIYRTVQKEHAFAVAGGLIPDLVLRVKAGDTERWALVEVKGVERSVTDSACAAINDLLAYRRAFEPVLGKQANAYGIGIAWGADLEPTGTAEIVLCSPDTLPDALSTLGL